jgi:hypothetical protein
MAAGALTGVRVPDDLAPGRHCRYITANFPLIGAEKVPQQEGQGRFMARQFIYHMQGLSKVYPGNRKILENIHL